jgi:hypothetical protein
MVPLYNSYHCDTFLGTISLRLLQWPVVLLFLRIINLSSLGQLQAQLLFRNQFTRTILYVLQSHPQSACFERIKNITSRGLHNIVSPSLRSSADCAHCFFLRRCSRSGLKCSAAQHFYTIILTLTHSQRFTHYRHQGAHSCQAVYDCSISTSFVLQHKLSPSTWPQDILQFTSVYDVRQLFHS